MSRVEELESQIKILSCSEFQELRAWLAEHDAEIWDRRFHDDVREGPGITLLSPRLLMAWMVVPLSAWIRLAL
jgi:hypothetical protein